MSSAISVHGLVKTFGATRALDGLDLDVTPGQVLLVRATRTTVSGPDSGRVVVHFRKVDPLHDALGDDTHRGIEVLGYSEIL